MSSYKKDTTPSKNNSGSSSGPRPTSSLNKEKSSRKLPRPEIKIHPDDKPNPLGREIDEPKAIPWGLPVFESTSSTGSSLSDDDDGIVDDHSLSKNGNKQNDQHRLRPFCYHFDYLTIQEQRLLKQKQELIEENRILRYQNYLLEEEFAAYKMANPESSKKSSPKVATPTYSSPTGPSSPPLEWESSLIIENYRDGLRKENDPQSVATAEHSEAIPPKKPDPHDWCAYIDFSLQKLVRNSVRIQAETGNPTQPAGGGTTEPVASPESPPTRPPPSNSPKSPTAKEFLRFFLRILSTKVRANNRTNRNTCTCVH